MTWSPFSALGEQLINAGIPADLVTDALRDAGENPKLLAYCLQHYGADLQIVVDVLEQRLGEHDSPEEAIVRDDLI